MVGNFDPTGEASTPSLAAIASGIRHGCAGRPNPTKQFPAIDPRLRADSRSVRCLVHVGGRILMPQPTDYALPRSLVSV